MQVSRSKELGHTISINARHCKRNRDGREANIVNVINEASRFHVAPVLKEGDELGHLTATDYIDGVRMNWFRFARAPTLIRLDSEGALDSHELREWCAARGIEVQMAAGEAHWQTGIVETLIRLMKNQLQLMEDEFPEASIDELVEHCVAAKVRRQTFDGYSPLQWRFGTQCAREIEDNGLGQNESSFERRLEYQTPAQTDSVLADARKTLACGQHAEITCAEKSDSWTIGDIFSTEQRWGRWRSSSWSWWKDSSLWSCKSAGTRTTNRGGVTSRSSCVVSPWRIFDTSGPRAFG